MMKKYLKSFLSLLLCMALLATLGLMLTGCTGNMGTETEIPETVATATFTDGQTLGEGEKEFTLVVTDAEGNNATATIRTNETIVGDALLALNLIAGEKQTVGLYVKTVNGITCSYEQDKMYWGFFIDGEYALTGIDQTEIIPGAVYALKAIKAE